MKIDILCNDGSPLGVTSKTIYGDTWQIGCGGAELALLTMCETWQSLGHEVTLYNNPREFGASPFEQRNIGNFDPNEKRDVIIIFRSPNPRGIVSNALKVWWSCDQYTVGNFKQFATHVDKIVGISPFHVEYFRTTYGIDGVFTIDLPVRIQEYNLSYSKIPNRLLFSSIPDRGLDVLRDMWGGIQKGVPDVSLVITSDYRLWGTPDAMNQRHRVRWIPYASDIHFLGAIPREKLVTQQLAADLLVYPCTYEELFCISCAEAMCAGAIPITSIIGALNTTNDGIVIKGHPDSLEFKKSFINEVTTLLENRTKLAKMQRQIRKGAMKRFDPLNIAKQWDEKIFN